MPAALIDPCHPLPFQAQESSFLPASYIDQADLSALAADFGKQCTLLPKPGSASEMAAMLEWFGVASTGRMIVVGPQGETVPEYTIVDQAKNLRAMADPYGYKRNLASSATQVPWSQVKELYR